MANLGYKLSDQTVGNILRRHDIPPAHPQRRLFYRCGGDFNCSRFHYSRFHTLFLRLHVHSEVEKIIHRMAEILFAP